MAKTIEQAYDLVKSVKVCTIFQSDKVDYTSLWEHVEIPDKKPGEKGWGDKMGAVWSWKNQLPAEYPDEIFYGKIKGGLAVLMDMEYLVETHFPEAHRSVDDLNQLSQYVYDQISTDPSDTTSLRNTAMQDVMCTKSQFDTALKNLQVSLNIARLNHPEAEHDIWVTFQEQYPDIWARYVGDE